MNTRAGWLTREDGDVIAALEIADGRRARRRGLRGRDELRGALVLKPCRQVHTFGMRFPIDVAFCDGAGVVLVVWTLEPRRLCRPVIRARFAVEAEAGSFERWGIRPGDGLCVVEPPASADSSLGATA